MTPECRQWHRERAQWATDRGLTFAETLALLERDWLALLGLLAAQVLHATK